jgi:hypothetical protein
VIGSPALSIRISEMSVELVVGRGAVPKRFSGGNSPLTEPAGSRLVKWMLGNTRPVPRRTSCLSRPLRTAGFQ